MVTSKNGEPSVAAVAVVPVAVDPPSAAVLPGVDEQQQHLQQQNGVSVGLGVGGPAETRFVLVGEGVLVIGDSVLPEGESSLEEKKRLLDEIRAENAKMAYQAGAVSTM